VEELVRGTLRLIDIRTNPLDSGRAMPANDVIIMLNGKECPTGTPGEVWMRGPNVMKGYWGDPGMYCFSFGNYVAD